MAKESFPRKETVQRLRQALLLGESPKGLKKNHQMNGDKGC